jgi:hypothetical protein
MTEFTKKFIEKQKNIISKASPLPWARCNCGKCADIMSIPLDAEVADLRSHQDECEEEGFPYSKKHMEDVDLIVAACNNFPEALDEIERLQARVVEVEDNREHIEMLLVKAEKRITELEEELKNKCANCRLAISHGIWGDEDSEYDNLSQEEE